MSCAFGDDDLADRRRRGLAVRASARRAGDVAIRAKLATVELDPLFVPGQR